MELIKSAARRTRVSEVIYVLLNLIYAALLLFLLVEFEGQPYFAYLVVVLSKWRVLAVRPRFWVANIQTNLLDTIMGLSVVTLLWQNMGHLSYQIGVVALFAIWLILLKPRSKRHWVILQGGLTQFVALTALFSVAHTLNIVFVVLLGWFVGFVTARHIINVFGDEFDDAVLSMIWGMVVAELSWLMYYWTIAYTPLKVPQISMIVSLMGYAVLNVYSYLYHHHTETKHDWRNISMPVLFSTFGILLILIFFNNFDPTSM